jgi:DNA invertase Pin-like site-specific DNA recombinase
MTSAALYARVSSARQKKDQAIGSQTQALRAHARQLGLEVPEDWIFEDEGHSGATLLRPALEALRDLAAQGCVDVVLCYSPDRLARKFAYQALLIEEFNRAGVRVEFASGPRGDSPEDQLLVQFQGMFAEYEKAQLMERYRRGKAYRARSGSVNVLGGAPFGYRYVRKTPDSAARYEILQHEALLVAEMFRRYADDGATIADLARWLAKAATSITAMIQAYSEQLITIDELRAKMPHLRAREASLRGQLDALDAQAADRDAYLKLAGDLEGFLARLRGKAATASTDDRRRVLRLLVKDILIGPEKITIRHRIPVREPAGSGGGHHDATDTEGDMRESYELCWGRGITRPG